MREASWPPAAGAFEIGFEEGSYPALLRATDDPPKVLRGFGDPKSLRPGLGVIGARKATPYGLRCARLFAGWAAAAGYVVISGAAVGCDTAAPSRTHGWLLLEMPAMPACRTTSGIGPDAAALR